MWQQGIVFLAVDAGALSLDGAGRGGRDYSRARHHMLRPERYRAGCRGMIPARSTVLVVGRQRNQIARGAGLLQGSIRRPGQRRCRSPALRAIGLRGRTVAGVAARDRLFGGRCRGLVIRWSGSRRKGLFARPAPHVTAGTLPGGLQGDDSCTIHGIGCGAAAEPDRPGGRAPTGKHPPAWAEAL